MQGRGWKQNWAENDVNCDVGVLGASAAHQRSPGVKMTGLWSISLSFQVEAALLKVEPLGGSSLLLRQDLSQRAPRNGSKPCPPEGGSQLHHTLLGFLHYTHYTLRYSAYLLVYVTTAFCRRRGPCPSYSSLENGKRLEQNSHSVNTAK